MFRKFLVILLFMAALGVSSALLLRELVVRDFQRLSEAEQEDRVSWVVTDLENAYSKQGNWGREMAVEDAIWALQLGLETRVRDRACNIVMDTAAALASLDPTHRARLLAVTAIDTNTDADFQAYPLFLHGSEIGQLEVKFLPDSRNRLFVSRTDRLLAYAAMGLGVIACILSVLLARRLSRPIQRLSRAALNISQGNLAERVEEVAGGDELASLNRSFNKMAHTLQLQNRLRKEICANLAHELRTPLTIMRGQLEGILDGVICNDESRIRMLLEENLRLTNVVASMEDFFEAQSSVLTLSPCHIPIRQLFDNLVMKFEVAAREKRIELRVETDDEPTVWADPERLSQVLINLIGNALKATPTGGAITLGGRKTSGGCAITIADTGSGIAEEDLPLIFERFYRGKGGGLGLGLAIVRELVDAHGGAIEVSSQKGAGTVFKLLFPNVVKTP